MDAITQGNNIIDGIKWEIEPRYTRAKLTIAQDADATEGLDVLQVLEASTGKEIVCATGANANAILLEPVTLADLVAGDVSRMCLVRGPALVNTDALTVESNIKTAALAALAALNIRALTEPDEQETMD